MSLPALDLNLLLVLHTVLSERSVARAARRLSVTPSAVSNALARLRGALGDPLTARSGRGIVPTPRAAALAPVLARALGELEEAVRGTEFDPRSTDREFTLAASDAGQLARVPRFVALLAKEMPRARLRVVSIDTLHAAGGLASLAADVCIGGGERAPGIHAVRLWDEPVVLVARKDHRQATSRISKRVLAKLRHVEVQVTPGKSTPPLAPTYAAQRVPRVVAAIVPTFTAAAGVAAATDLVASLPRSLFDVLGPRLGLHTVTTPLRPLVTTINLMWHERTEHEPALKAFRELLLRA